MKGLAFNAYGTLIDAARIAEAVARFTRAAAEFAATWRAKQIGGKFHSRVLVQTVTETHAWEFRSPVDGPL